VQWLHRSYPLLLVYFLADFAQEMVALQMPPTSRAYFYTYLGGQALKLVLAALIVLDLTRIALSGHPALARFGHRTAGYLMLLLAGIACAGLYLGPAVPPKRYPALHYFLSFERTMDSVLVVFLIVISLFLLWFPLKLRRNAALYIGGFVAYFLVRTMATLAADGWPALTRGINVAALSCSALCLMAWVALLRREGETGQVLTGHRWNPEAMERLTGQLNTINSRLMRM
jgi:hypothetical protein